MTYEQLITIGIVVVAVILFVTEWMSVDLIGLVIISFLMMSGVLTASEAIQGFSNSATITITMMFVLSAALVKTGQLSNIGYYLSEALVKNRVKGILLLMIFTGLISAFINNTPVVAVFIPIVLSACAKANLSPSKILIPLSFASIFGGVCTLVGTSTNILVSSIAESHGLKPFGMFEMTPVGLIFFATGMLFLLLIGIKLIPDRGNQKSLEQKFDIKIYLTDIRLLPQAPSVGKTVANSPLVKELEMDIIELKRGDDDFFEPDLSLVLAAGDVLRVRATIDQIKKIQKREGVEIIEGTWEDENLQSDKSRIIEIIITPNSDLHGKTISQMRFKHQYNAIVLAIRGRKGILHRKLSRSPLQSGDVLLLRVKKEFLQRFKNSNRITENPFLIISETEEIKPIKKKNMIFTFSVLSLVVLLAALNIIQIVASSIMGVTLLVMFRSLSMQEAYKSIDWRVIFLIAGTISLGVAIENTGIAKLIAENLIYFLGGLGPIALVSALYLVTSLLTEVMSNSASAVLLTPIAITTAETLGVDPKPFLFAIAFAASSSFLTPVGYQTNTMIYSAGSYKFTDFFRVGILLNIIFWILATILIPLFYKF